MNPEPAPTDINPSPPSAIEQAVAALGEGGAAILARHCHVTRQAVQTWLLRGSAPPNRILIIERVTGVSRHALRPDVFGPGSGR